jgi:hypothetical protein
VRDACFGRLPHLSFFGCVLELLVSCKVDVSEVLMTTLWGKSSFDRPFFFLSILLSFHSSFFPFFFLSILLSFHSSFFPFFFLSILYLNPLRNHLLSQRSKILPTLLIHRHPQVWLRENGNRVTRHPLASTFSLATSHKVRNSLQFPPSDKL